MGFWFLGTSGYFWFGTRGGRGSFCPPLIYSQQLESSTSKTDEATWICGATSSPVDLT